jgi:6-phosphogluconolactonase (cycloisomerase 2 family)
VNVFSVAADGTLTNVDIVTDDVMLELDGATHVTAAVVGGTTYLFVAARDDDGVSVFSVAADGTLTSVDNVTDDATLHLDRAEGVTAAIVDGTTYLFMSGLDDSGVSVFSVAADGTLANVDNVTDDAMLELDGARDVATVIVAGTTYLFVTGAGDDGVSVFSVAADGTLTNVDNVDDADDAALELDGALGVAIAVVGGATYLFVSGLNDDGVSVFAVAADGTLANVDNVSDDATLELDDAAEIETVVVDGTTYLVVTGNADAGVSVFSVAADGTLTNENSVADDAILQLNGAFGLTTALVGATTYLFVTGEDDQGVSAFSLIEQNPAPPAAAASDFNGDLRSDILWREDSGMVALWEMDGVAVLSNQGVGPLPGSSQIVGSDGDFNGDGMSDILLHGEAGAVVLWEMNGPTIIGNTAIATLPAHWRIAGTGDFTGDGRADILWRENTGRVVLWEMDGAQIVSNTLVADVATSSHIQTAPISPATA